MVIRGFIVILGSYFRNHALFFPPFSRIFTLFFTPPKTPYFPTGPTSLLVVIRGFPPTIITITAWEPSFLVRFFVFFHVKVDAYVLYTFTKYSSVLETSSYYVVYDWLKLRHY